MARRIELIAEPNDIRFAAVDKRLENSAPAFQHHLAQVLSAAKRYADESDAHVLFRSSQHAVEAGFGDPK